MFSNTKTHETGFTLLELAIAVLILGTIAAITFPLVLDFQTSGTRSSLKADLLQTSITIAPAMNELPTDVSALEHLAVETEGNIVTIEGTWSDYYISASNPS